MEWCETISALRKRELQTVRKTKKELKKELRFVEHLIDIFLKTFDVLGKLVDADREFTRSEDASYRIAWKIFRIVRCAFDSSLKGYYDISIALLRIAFENYLLLIYLSENEKEAELWFKGKTFRPAFLRKKMKWTDPMYRGMSEFIHSSFRSTLFFTKIEGDESRGTLGEFDKEKFRIAAKQVLMTLWATIIWLFTVFPEIAVNEEWRSVCQDNLLEITRYVRTLD